MDVEDDEGRRVYYRDDEVGVVEGHFVLRSPGSEGYIPLSHLSNFTFIDVQRKRRYCIRYSAAGLILAAAGAATHLAGVGRPYLGPFLGSFLIAMGASMAVTYLWELFTSRNARRWTVRGAYRRGHLVLLETDDTDTFVRFMKALRQAGCDV